MGLQRMFSWKSKFFVFCLLCLQVAAELKCPYGWIARPNSNSCYRIVTGEARYTYDDAQSRCQSFKGSLFKLDSVAERDWLFGKLRSLSNVYQTVTEWWTGLSNNGDGKGWVWQDGTAMDVSVVPWANGVPTVDGRKNCATISMLKFNKVSCSQWKRLLCERPKNLPFVCDSDGQWDEMGSWCFKFFDTKRSWHDASMMCERENADLTTINTYDIQVYVWDQAKTYGGSLWSGLFSQLSNNALTWVWQGMSGTLESGTNYWASGQPGNVMKRVNNTCVEVNKDRRRKASWIASSCDTTYSYICQKIQGTCQDGWLQHQSNCFQFNPRFSLTWNRAEQYCRSQGGSLAKITSRAGQAFLNKYLIQQRGAGINGLWIGITDGGIDNGPYLWSDKSALGKFTNWASNATINTPGSRDCGFIDTSDRRGRWQTTSDCIQLKSFICVIGVNAAVNPVTTPIPTYHCDAGWDVFGDQCYKLDESEKTWVNANKECKSSSAKLVKIPDTKTQAFLNGRIQGQDYWIGLHDRDNEGNFKWLDGTAPVYTYWNKGEPNNLNGENCGAILGSQGGDQNGKWNDYACGRKFGFICQKLAKNTPTSSPLPTTQAPTWTAKCGAFWESSPHSDYCYQFSDQQLSWLDARGMCAFHGGKLASIVTLEEQYYISGRIRSMSSTSLWIGASDRSTESGWRWDDESPFAYLNWAAGEPNDFGNNEDCASMFVKTSKWNDFACDRRNGYICKKLGVTTGTTPPPPTSPNTIPAGSYYGCPPGWKGYRLSCYLMVRQDLSWSKALDACHAQGAHLTSILNGEENKFIMSQMPRGLNDGFWIGFNDLKIQMNFQWTDDSTSTYTNWAKSEPNNYAGKHEDCVVMYTYSGMWNDDMCDNNKAGYVCKMAKKITALTQQPSYSVGCPGGAMGYQHSCYNFSTNPLSWQDAENYCKGQNGHLATVNDRFVQAFLAAELINKDDDYWIGLADVSSPGTYTWTSGVKLAYTPWANSHTGTERSSCVSMKTDRPVGLWKSVACNLRKPFICESPRAGFTTPVPTTPPQTTPVSCPTNWYGFQGMCYRGFQMWSQMKKTWTEAQAYCRGFGGDLISIHNHSLEVFLTSTVLRHYYNGNFWIGLNDRDAETSFTWSDGSPYDYNHWQSTEPNNFHGMEDCTEYNQNSGMWNDNTCSLAKDFICQIPNGVTLASTTVAPTFPTISCKDNGWRYYNGFCYFISKSYGIDARKTWFESRRYCMSQGGDLVTIVDVSENNFITTLISKQSTPIFWIGLNELGLSGYQWADGKPVIYKTWAKGEPNDAYGGQKCVDMYSSNGHWNDDNCMDPNGFICKRRNDTTSPKPVVPTPLISGGCPANFQSIDNKCFYIGGQMVSDQKNWTSARDACRALKMNRSEIASLSSYTEQAFVLTLVKNINISVWIGLFDKNVNRRFIWQDNSEVAYTNWDKGEPSDKYSYSARTRQDCVEIYTNGNNAGKWNDQVCTLKRAYVCQVLKDKSIPTPTPPTSQCKLGYSQFGTSCYKVSPSRLNWSNAQSTCQTDKGNLVSVTDIYEKSFVDVLAHIQRVQLPFWVGLSDSKVKGTYTWSDGWPVWYTNWGNDEPSRADGEGCVAQENLKWNDTLCNRTLPFICEISSTTPPPSTPIPPGYCPDKTWHSFGDYCYYGAPSDAKSWPEAQYACKHMGMELASVHSQTEQDFIKQLVEASTTTSRYYYVYNRRNIWSGLQRAREGGFMWSDGSPSDFTNWDSGEPSASGGNEDCMEIYVTSWKWNDLDCYQNRGYVCKTLKTFPSSPTTTTTTPPPPPTTTTTPPPSPPPTTKASNMATTKAPNRGTTKLLSPTVPTKMPVITYHPIPKLTPLSQTSQKSVNLSGGQIAGILIGTLGFIIIASVVIIVFKRRRTWGLPSSSPSGFDNALYKKGEEDVSVSNGNNAHMYMRDPEHDNLEHDAEC